MYTEQDYQNARATMKRMLIISGLLVLVPFAGMIVGLIIRSRVLTIGMAILAGWVFYFLLQFKCMPWIRYVLWMKDMRNGLNRETEGQFVRLSPDTRISDGITVHDFIIRIGDKEEDERLFLWDDDKPLPTIGVDKKLHITSYGNYIIKLDIL